MGTAFWYGTKQYVVEKTTKKEKEILKALNPELHARYFKDEEVKAPKATKEKA